MMKDRSRSSRRDRDNSRGYKKMDSAAVRKRASSTGSSRDYVLTDDFPRYTPAEKNSIRILPMPESAEGVDHYAIDSHIHYGVGGDENQYLCPKKMRNEDCPICEEADRARDEGDDEYADKLKPTYRPICMVIDRKDEDKVKVWAMPWTVDRDILSVAEDEESGEVLQITDPFEGYDVSFNRSGKGQRVQYGAPKVARKPTQALESEKEVDKLLELLNEKPLPELLVFHDYDHIARAFGKKGAVKKESKRGRDADDDDDDDDKPAKRGTKSSSKRKAPPVPSWKEVHKMDFDELCELIEEHDLDIDTGDYDEEDKEDVEQFADVVCSQLDIDEPKASSRKSRDEEEEEEEEEEDDRASKRGSSKKKSSVKKRPRDEEEEEEEEEDDEPPSRKSRLDKMRGGSRNRG